MVLISALATGTHSRSVSTTSIISQPYRMAPLDKFRTGVYGPPALTYNQNTSSASAGASRPSHLFGPRHLTARFGCDGVAGEDCFGITDVAGSSPETNSRLWLVAFCSAAALVAWSTWTFDKAPQFRARLGLDQRFQRVRNRNRALWRLLMAAWLLATFLACPFCVLYAVMKPCLPWKLRTRLSSVVDGVATGVRDPSSSTTWPRPLHRIRRATASGSAQRSRATNARAIRARRRQQAADPHLPPYGSARMAESPLVLVGEGPPTTMDAPPPRYSSSSDTLVDPDLNVLMVQPPDPAFILVQTQRNRSMHGI